MKTITAITFTDGKLKLIDQRRLPIEFVIFECMNFKDVEFAIRDMVVRGAPAIGAVAAYGVYFASDEFKSLKKENYIKHMKEACKFINNSRPTAVNLMWAVDKMERLIIKNIELNTIDITKLLKGEADKILFDDIKTNKKMAEIGNEIVLKGATILTHCNTGALATGGYGTALGVIREAHYTGKDIFVYADETRPRLQGAKLTAWELKQENIPFQLIADSAAATLIRDGKIDLILVGADRIAKNGDTANKIGTFMLSVVAKEYKVPFYVVAPVSTIDFKTSSGEDIVIEERSSEEITHIQGVRIAPEEIEVYNPAFDVTPAQNITGIITDKGIIQGNFIDGISKLNNIR